MLGEDEGNDESLGLLKEANLLSNSNADRIRNLSSNLSKFN